MATDGLHQAARAREQRIHAERCYDPQIDGPLSAIQCVPASQALHMHTRPLETVKPPQSFTVDQNA
jgi:hypothetical protein